jgi:hypothetical protein
MEDRQDPFFEFQPNAHNDEREQGRRQDCEQRSQSSGATPIQLTSLFALALCQGTAAPICRKQTIVIL